MSIGRVLAWPFRRLLDPRFGGLAKQADVQHRDLSERVDELARTAADRDTVLEILEQIRGELATLRADLVALPGRELAALREELTAAARAEMDATRETNQLLARTLGDVLAETTATTIALEEALGRKSRLESTDAKGAVGATNRNEAFVELPYVYRALAGVEAGASVLNVGSAGGTLASRLASVGFHVTSLDRPGSRRPHPRVEAVDQDFLNWRTDRTFDAVLCVSTVEHAGAGAHGSARDDPPTNPIETDAIERMRSLTRPGGILVLTLPFGQRAYDRTTLDRLFANWDIEDLTIVREEGPLMWIPDDGSDRNDASRVALITARRPSG